MVGHIITYFHIVLLSSVKLATCQYGGGKSAQSFQSVINDNTYHESFTNDDYQEYFNDNHGFNPSDYPNCQCEYKFNDLGQGNCNSGNFMKTLCLICYSLICEKVQNNLHPMIGAMLQRNLVAALSILVATARME